MKQIAKYSYEVFFLIFFFLLLNSVYGQDTTKLAPPDTVKITTGDTTQLVAQDSVYEKEKVDKKRKDSFFMWEAISVTFPLVAANILLMAN